MCRKVCGGDVTISKGEHEYGLAAKLSFVCVNCGDLPYSMESPHTQGSQKINLFAVNSLAARAMESTGNRQTVLNDAFAAMNTASWPAHENMAGYVTTELTPAATRAAESVAAQHPFCLAALQRV